MTTLAEFRTYVRTHLDLDATDLPDVLVDEFIREGARFIQYNRARWPFYEGVWRVTTQAGIPSYYVTLLQDDPLVFGQPANNYVLAEIREIRRGSDGTIIPFLGQGTPRQPVTPGTPEGFYLWSTTLTFDPAPSQVEEYVILGYREPRDWVASGPTAEPDTPPAFDGVIRMWALGKAYAHQEESNTSVFFLDSAQYELDRLTAKLDDLPPGRLVMNSRGRKSQYWVGEGIPVPPRKELI